MSQTFPYNFREMNDPTFKPVHLNHGKSTPEFCSIPNNPIGRMPRMNDDPYINNWMNSVTSANELPYWNMNLNFSNNNSSDIFDGFHDHSFDSFNQDYSITNEISEYNSLVPNFQTKPQQTDCLMALETSSYLACIPELLPGNQGSITCYNPSQYALYDDLKITMNDTQLQKTEPLRHSLVPSPTDSGFRERSSTGSFSSVLSCEGMALDDLGSTLNDSVF